MRLPSHFVVAAASIALAASGCADARDSDAAPPHATVFAAASLTAAFEELARAFEQRSGARVDLHCAGTPQLVLQLREGAPVDVFASADPTNMQRAVATGRVRSQPVVFATNRLTIVTRKGNPAGVHSLADLARADLRVVLCGPDVPAGRYAREALDRAGVRVASVSDEPSVKAVVTKLTLGEVDAGIVYVTDAMAAANDVDAIPLASEHGSAQDSARDIVAAYPIALIGPSAGTAVDASPGAATGAAFVEFVTSPEGREILERFGFGGPR